MSELVVTETVSEENKEPIVAKYSEDKFINAALTAIHGAPVVNDETTDKPADKPVDSTITPGNDELADKTPLDIDKIISEKTGGKFLTLDDVVSKVGEVNEVKFENEESKLVYNLLLEGKMDEVADVLAERKVDYKSIDDISMLKMGIKRDKPYLSDEDINDIISDEYGVGESVTEEDKQELSPAQLKEKEARIGKNARLIKRESNEYRNKFDVAKASIKLPELKAKEADAPVEDPGANAVKEWIKQIDDGVKASPAVIDHNFSIEIQDGNNKVNYAIPFKIEGKEKETLDNYVKNFLPAMGTEANYVKDGKVDVDLIRQEGIDRLFGKKMFGVLLKEAIAKTKQSVIGGIKQINVPIGETVPAQTLSNEEWLIKKAMHT